jgi:hypothetical protein
MNSPVGDYCCTHSDSVLRRFGSLSQQFDHFVADYIRTLAQAVARLVSLILVAFLVQDSHGLDYEKCHTLCLRGQFRLPF